MISWIKNKVSDGHAASESLTERVTISSKAPEEDIHSVAKASANPVHSIEKRDEPLPAHNWGVSHEGIEVQELDYETFLKWTKKA